MGRGSIRFETADGVALEGELRLPEGAPAAVAVLCHAHSRHGGSKDHPLLWAISIEREREGAEAVGEFAESALGLSL